MEDNKKSPALRFAGFTEDWEEDELDLLAEFSKGQGYSKNDLKTVGTPIILYGRLYTKYQTVIEDVDTYTNPQENSYYSIGGEVIVPASGETQEDIVRASVVTKPDVILGGDLNIIKPNESIDSSFLALTISNGKVYRDLVKKAQGKSVVHIRNNDLKETAIPYPSKGEQQQIGSFFKNIDELITKHQKKHDRLVTLKKSMLEKMFPKEGQAVPEIRFKGFEGDWGKDKLGNLVNLLTGKPFESKQFVDKGVLLLRGINVKRGVLNTSEDLCAYWPTIKGSEEYVLRQGDILIQMDGALIGKSYAKVKDKHLPALLVQRVTRIRGERHTLEIIFQQLKRDFLKYIQSFKTETAVPHLSLQNIYDFPASISKDENEQLKIAKYFKQMDDLITNHQKQLKKLSNLKQSFSEKMFV